MRIETKLILIMGLILISALGNGGILWALLLFGILFIRAAGLGIPQLLKNLKSYRWFVLFIVVVPILSTPGEPLLSVTWFPFEISREGWNQGWMSGGRVLLMFMWSWILLQTTTPEALVETVEYWTSRFVKTDSSLKEFLVVGVLAFQMIPLIWQQIEEELSKRLVFKRFENQTILKKLRGLTLQSVSLLVKVFLDHKKVVENIKAGHNGV